METEKRAQQRRGCRHRQRLTRKRSRDEDAVSQQQRRYSTVEWSMRPTICNLIQIVGRIEPRPPSRSMPLPSPPLLVPPLLAQGLMPQRSMGCGPCWPANGTHSLPPSKPASGLYSYHRGRHRSECSRDADVDADRDRHVNATDTEMQYRSNRDAIS
eukprot:Gb_04764 [translate_table: standard]